MVSEWLPGCLGACWFFCGFLVFGVVARVFWVVSGLFWGGCWDLRLSHCLWSVWGFWDVFIHFDIFYLQKNLVVIVMLLSSTTHVCWASVRSLMWNALTSHISHSWCGENGTFLWMWLGTKGSDVGLAVTEARPLVDGMRLCTRWIWFSLETSWLEAWPSEYLWWWHKHERFQTLFTMTATHRLLGTAVFSTHTRMEVLRARRMFW